MERYGIEINPRATRIQYDFWPPLGPNLHFNVILTIDNTYDITTAPKFIPAVGICGYIASRIQFVLGGFPTSGFSIPTSSEDSPGPSWKLYRVPHNEPDQSKTTFSIKAPSNVALSSISPISNRTNCLQKHQIESSKTTPPLFSETASIYMSLFRATPELNPTHAAGLSSSRSVNVGICGLSIADNVCGKAFVKTAFVCRVVGGKSCA